MKSIPAKFWITVILLTAFFVGIPAAQAETFPADFITGVDVSELIAQEASGVKYYDEEGNEADALKVLADYGVKSVRIRIWNDPFDENGNGYGGGNTNADVAAALSARAAALGMKTLLDFHYSDFWADPTRQLVPKAWKDLDLNGKAEAVYSFTRETLSLVLDAGGEVNMVQIGNEINNGMCGESDLESMAALLRAGSKVVREIAAERGIEVQVCIHLTDPQNSSYISGKVGDYINAGVDFDSVGLSYYPYWHGSFADLRKTIQMIRDLGKEVFIAETSWPFSLEEGDASGNVIGSDPGIYPVSPEGQAQAVEEILIAAADSGAFGAFYWGGIWTPVGTDLNSNQVLWEKYGSGWASVYAVSYDPENVSDFYGGCAWDNQAMFGFDGHPLPVLDTYRSLAAGEVIYDPEAYFPTEDTSDEPIEAESENLVRNPGFEEEDRSMWNAASNTADIPFDYQDKVNDAHDGTVAFHFWSQQAMDFYIEQILTGLGAGTYEASVWSQGGDMKDAVMTFYVRADGAEYTADFMNTKWIDWQHPVISDIPVVNGELTIGVHITCGPKSWGTLDGFSVTAQP